MDYDYSDNVWMGFLVFFIIALVPYIFFLVAQQNTLKAVQSTNRSMEPSHVWLQLIPLFGLVWQFIVTKAIADSLRNELNARNLESKLGIWEDGITDEVNIHPTYTTGKWYCILVCITCVPFLGFFTVIFAIVLWISYWGQLNKYRHIIAM
jgi:hypothetical protein